MTSNYKRQHYVPQTYLEAWNDDTNKVRVYKKEDNMLYKYSNVDKVLYENDLYTKTVEDTLVLTYEEKCEIFKSLTGYKVFYKNQDEEKELVTVEDFAIYFFDFDNWTIIREDNTVVGKKTIKDLIQKVRITILEEQWSSIENHWGVLKNKIDNCIQESKSLESSDLEEILEFMVAQKWRTPKALEECDNIIENVLVSVKDYLGTIYEVEKKSFGNAYFKKQILKFQSNDVNSNILKKIEILRKFLIVFIKPIGKTFITSDNPVLTLIDKEFFNGNYNGIYFPIAPSLLIALYKGDNNRYTVGTMRANIVRRFNTRIKKNSLKYYVTNYEL